MRRAYIKRKMSGWIDRKLILTSLDYTRPKDPPISLGQASILANLKAHNIDTISSSWSVNHEGFSYQKVVEFIMNNASSNTDVALGAFVWNERATKQILLSLKEQKFPGKIILGGPQISYVKQRIEPYYPEADLFIRGYAEEALANLYQSDEEKPNITGIHYAGSPDKGLSANADLENLPSPFLDQVILPQRFIRWETQRGCPFRCSFCQHRESDISQTRRYFKLSRILQEAEWITNNKVIQDVAILDPTFNSGRQYLEVMKQLIAGKYSGKLALQIRLEMITDEFLDTIEELNKTGRVVLEGGIQTIHKEEQRIIQRPNNMKKVKRALEAIKERNIEVELSLIFGLPGQTVESFQQSIDFCKEAEATKIFAFPLMLLRGTPLHYEKDKLNLKESSDINIAGINRLQTDIPHVISSSSFDYSDWQIMAKLAEDLSEYNERNSVSYDTSQAILRN